MTIGSSSLYSGESYLALGRETAFGTYATATAGLDFLSSSIKTLKDSKILEQIERKRTLSKSFGLGKTVEGDVAYYFFPEISACAFLLQNAFGGTVTSATTTIQVAETVGGLGFDHTFEVGSMDQSYTSISMNERKGPATSGRVWEYHGGRVNSLSMVAEIDEPLMFTASMIFKDSTQVSNDIESGLTITARECLSFADGRFSVESSFASLTSSSFWHVQNINFTLNNNLKNESNSRRIGTDTLDVLPVGLQNYELSAQIRFDTTTAYDAMIAGTELSAEFDFLGTTISGSLAQKALRMQFQKLTVKDAGDPEIGGPDETLISTVTFNVLRDESAAGYAVKAILTNAIADYT